MVMYKQKVLEYLNIRLGTINGYCPEICISVDEIKENMKKLLISKNVPFTKVFVDIKGTDIFIDYK
jgi:hypothetical protein